jgi:aspartate racemase
VKNIGIIGGLSWHTSAVYYRLINESINQRLGGLSSARCLLASLEFAEVERCQRAERWDRVAALLCDAARGLERAGADFFLIACNTVHLVADQVQAAVSIPLLHIVDATGRHVVARRLRTVGLLGSCWTLRADYFVDRLRNQYGLEVLLPEGQDEEHVDRAIYGELVRGIVTEPTRARLRAAIAHLAERGAEGVILGCTELMLALNAEDSAVPLFDTTRLHVEAAIDLALAE